MTRYKIDIHLRLELASGLHIGTGYGLAGYLDARTLTGSNGHPLIAGSSLKGRLRFYADQLLPGRPDEEKAPLVTLFGKENQEGCLFFGDLHLAKAWQDLAAQSGGRSAPPGLLTQRRTNVMLSRLRGVALERRLFTVEAAAPHLTFEGEISGVLPDSGRVLTIDGRSLPQDLALLVAACYAFTHLGGRKSRGLGRGRLVIEQDGLLIDDATVDPVLLVEALP